MSERLPVVFLVDVDDTLLDNDHIQKFKTTSEDVSNASLAQLVGTVNGRSSRLSLKSWLSRLPRRFAAVSD
jgi:hypothetical protein